MKIKHVIIATSILIFLLISACSSQYPIQTSSATTTNQDLSRFKPLSDAEKEKAVQITLNTPEASDQLKQGLIYTSTITWVGIVWSGSRLSEWYEFGVDAPAKTIPSDMPKPAVVYPCVRLTFGEPPKLLIEFAVDLSTEKAVFTQSHLLKSPP